MRNEAKTLVAVIIGIIVIFVAVMLLTGCSDSPTKPTILANFTWSQVTGTTSIRFVNSSTGGKGVNNKLFWDFGDGQLSNERNPINDYRMCGNWVVTLTTCPDTDFTSVKCDNTQQPVIVDDLICPESGFSGTQ